MWMAWCAMWASLMTGQLFLTPLSKDGAAWTSWSPTPPSTHTSGPSLAALRRCLAPPPPHLPPQTWDKIFEINVKATFLLFQACVPLFEARGGGSAVFVSSIGGFQPIPFLGPYSVSKTALFGLTKALATEVASDNIRVNCIAPGIIKTKFAEVTFRKPPCILLIRRP